MVIVVTALITRMKQCPTLAVNIIMAAMICLIAADHPVILVDSLIQVKVIAMMGSVRAVEQKEKIIFVLLPIFVTGINLVI